MSFTSTEKRIIAAATAIALGGIAGQIVSAPTIRSSQESLRLHYHGNCLNPDRLNIVAEGLTVDMQPLQIKLPKEVVPISERICGTNQIDTEFFNDTAPALCWVDYISSHIYNSSRINSCFVGYGETTRLRLSFKNNDLLYPYQSLAP